MAEIIITEENFENEVLNSDKPVLVDFWAQWCGPCRMLGPIIEEIANDYEGKVKVGKVNVDEQPNLASKYGIASIPTVIVFKNGKPEKTLVGLRSKNEIEKLLSEGVIRNTRRGYVDRRGEHIGYYKTCGGKRYIEDKYVK